MESSSSNRGSTGQLSNGGGGAGGMHHSLSTPAGVDCGGGGGRTSPATPKKGGKMLAIRVQMLDDTVTIFQVQAKALGRVLFEQVCKQLHLLEADYFGLEYWDDHNTRYWLDLQKPISRQLGLSLVDPLLYFCVKFYTPDPAQLEEEYTRYLFCLQVKRDLSQGGLQCNENTAALMASYIVQAECGDFVPEDYPDHTYLSSYKFVPQQDQELERKIMENHKKHTGQSPAEADLNLLETARRCELYGVKMHPAKDHENVALNLAVAHMGLIVFQNYTKINTFSWAKIRKISFKRKRFLVKLHPEGYGYYKDTVEFFFEGRNECKNFWKKCVENHGFFRCASVKHVSRHKTRVLSRGSSFRYSGKTQKQIIEFVRDNYVKRQTFQRSQSFRHSSAHSSASNMHSTTVGNSISAHPLLPLADSNLSVEVSKLSASLGSMGPRTVGRAASPTTKSASRHRGIATSWSSAPDTRPIEPAPIRTTNSPPSPPSPPPPFVRTTDQSPSSPEEDSATTSPSTTRRAAAASSPVAVHVAVHRADTGTTNRTTPITSQTPSSRNFTNNYPTQTQSQIDLGRAHPKRRAWRRSASCKELYDFSFEETGKSKRPYRPTKRPPLEKTAVSFEERMLESPITRYDDRPVYASSRDSSLEIHQDIMVLPDLEKVYSSSYPGAAITSYSLESVEDPGNYDLRDSQDDLSHDSYELIEKSDDEYSTSGEYEQRKRKPFNTRSCSLDSGNYLPSDSESERDKRHKCKSTTDVFLTEDPRDFPREIIPRKSDGSYYKQYKQFSRNSSVESSKTSKSSREKRSVGSRTSSQESKSDRELAVEKANGVEMFDSRTSSVESKSEYHDAPSYPHPYDRKITFERNYGIQKIPNIEMNGRHFAHVHSISLQNVETEQNIKINRLSEQNTVPRTQKSYKSHVFDQRWRDDNQRTWPARRPTNADLESNIFSFDEEKIQSLQDSLDSDVCPDHYRIVPNIDTEMAEEEKKNYRDVFVEIEPRIVHDLPLHQPIERTKSDPNSLARQRLNSSSRRLLLMHQKSIDLTPAESSDEDYLFKQIPSAPPIAKFRGTRFELPPTAEFGHFDIIKRRGEKFEVPKSQFEVLGAKTQSDLINLPPKEEDLSYVLHKRHVTNGTAARKEESNQIESKKPQIDIQEDEKPKDSTFLFTRNIDLSKVDPVTLEIDKTQLPIQHSSSPKRDITHIDPVLLEALNSKLSQIESDSPTSSKTESLRAQKTKPITTLLQAEKPSVIEEAPETRKEPDKPPVRIKTDIIKPKRVIKPRMQPGKKGGKSNKTKVRITSFSSDDESLDSDDVFGSAEATPTRVEFSPPQMRKEMESILKFESERKYLQYTMSSTEVEGSPPTSRKKKDNKAENGLDATPTELRRISERSLSIPSSEDDFNIRTTDLQPVFTDPLPEPLRTLEENDREDYDKSIDETLKEDYSTDKELTTIEDEREREREKQQLQAEIENDIKNLKVPSKTRITEITSPSLRKQGHSPLLFAHARLNLSEGSAFSLLQKQQALESPVAGRRAKSLDAPVIPVSRLPPLNAFSSKDDTVAEEDQHMTDKDSGLENYLVSDKSTEERSDTDEAPNKPLPDIPRPRPLPEIPAEEAASNDQIVPDVINRRKSNGRATLQTKHPQKLAKSKQSSKSKAGKVKTGEAKASKAISVEESPRKSVDKQTDSKKGAPKERVKSLEKLELKRSSSKERSKSQDDSEARRIEKQQMLYEIAIQQTKTLKSPVKDTLPVFPQVEEMVRERHGKLEISINTIETNVSLEEAIIITKSPKKLDKKMGEKLTKSLDLNIPELNMKNVTRLGKSLDLDSRQDEDQSGNEFDFKPETIQTIRARDLEETSPQEDVVKETVEADVHQEEDQDKIVLKGTTLDVWLSVEERNKKLQNIEIIRRSDDFFERRASPKPPDLSKSSSDSQSTEKMSLGESLDIRYIDESTGDSSCKSEKDAQLMAELRKASNTVSKFLKKKLEKRRILDESPTDSNLRITSEEESLTEVSELKGEIDKNLLLVSDEQKDSLHKLSIERSRSEDTGSWITVECEEYVGTIDSLDYDNETPEKYEKELSRENVNLLTATSKTKLDMLKRSSDQSKSSDTGSWTSGEKDLSPGKEIKETDESSTSCAIGKTIGLSQHIEIFTARDLFEKGSPDGEGPRSPRSPRSPRICVLGRAFTIDEGSSSLKLDDSSSDEANDIPKDLTPIRESSKEEVEAVKKPYPFEEKWANDSELSQRLHKNLSKRLSSSEKDESLSDRRQRLDKPSFTSSERLSTESRNSVDTESSSGSVGAVCRTRNAEDIPKGLSSTWKAFPLDSSGSESFDDNLLPPDREEYFLRRNNGEYSSMSDVYYKQETDATPTRDETELPDDLAGFSEGFSYSLNLGGYAPTGYISRTLSRISERSTNSEKSSVDDDSTKASTQSDSLNDESMASSNPQVSVSSESPSHARLSESEKKTPTNRCETKEEDDKLSDLSKQEPLPHIAGLLQRQISDDRRTSAEMAELSMDDIEIITSERGLRLRRQGSDDTIIDEEYSEPEVFRDDRAVRSSSQESEDWPLPEIPQQGKKLLAMHEFPSSDTSQQTTQVFKPPVKSIPKTFGLKGSLRSQDSEQWPSPPSSVVAEPPVVGNVETYYITPPQEACKVIVDSSNVSTYDNDSNSNSDNDNKTHTYENVACDISESLSESLSVGPSGIKIVLEKKSNSDEDVNLNDDVFVDASDGCRSELRPPTAMRRSIASDSSQSERKDSYSEEECTSSMGTTNLEDGTVRYALKPSKCTHSSHSEDTSIALSLSEWSNSTNTVKFQNLSSNSGTKSSSGLKSDENSLTDIAHSVSEWSTSNTSSTLKAQAQQSSGLAFQKLSSASTGDSTLTDRLSNISDWSNSDGKPFFQQVTPTRLGSSIDLEEFSLTADAKGVPSPKNIPSEDLVLLTTLSMQLAPNLSDTDRSSSSMEHRTVHTQQRFEKDKQTYLLSKSTERPLKLSKCSPYYSSSLSSESTATPAYKTATVPPCRRKPAIKGPPEGSPSENESTSSVESPRGKSERDRRGCRRRRQVKTSRRVDEFCVVERAGVAEEGYYPDDSQSGSDIVRMEDEKYEMVEAFDVASIPPPLLEDDFENDLHGRI